MNEEDAERRIANLVGIVIVIALVVILVLLFLKISSMLPINKIPPGFSVARVNKNTIYIYRQQISGVGRVENLLVQCPSNVKGSLNSSWPTGEIEVGEVLCSKGVYPWDRYLVKGEINGKYTVVIECRV